MVAYIWVAPLWRQSGPRASGPLHPLLLLLVLRWSRASRGILHRSCSLAWMFICPSRSLPRKLIMIATTVNTHESSVGIVTRLPDDRKIRLCFPEIFPVLLLSLTSRQALGLTQPPTPWVSGAISPGVERPGREAHLSSPSSAEFKNSGAITSLRMRLHDMVLN
jgi:hypothetical protein